MHKYRWLYVLMIPALVYLFINNYMPLGGLIIAFKRVNFRVGVWKSPWAGWENFRYLFATKDAWIITHPHPDHTGAFNAIMDNEVQLRPIFRYRHIFPECIRAAGTDCPIEKVISDLYDLDEIQTAFNDSISRKNEVVKAAIRID